MYLDFLVNLVRVLIMWHSQYKQIMWQEKERILDPTTFSHTGHLNFMISYAWEDAFLRYFEFYPHELARQFFIIVKIQD